MLARHDPVVHRFAPDVTLVARAQRSMMETEDESTPRQRFVRQRWEESLGASRVALTALREIHPSELHGLAPGTQANLDEALDHLTQAWAYLDLCARDLLGDVMHDVLMGYIASHDILDELGVPRYADQT